MPRGLRDRLRRHLGARKKRHVEAALSGAPANVTYARFDFARASLGEVLRRAGSHPGRKTCFICAYVIRYIPNSESAPGSELLLEYLKPTQA